MVLITITMWMETVLCVWHPLGIVCVCSWIGLVHKNFGLEIFSPLFIIYCARQVIAGGSKVFVVNTDKSIIMNVTLRWWEILKLTFNNIVFANWNCFRNNFWCFFCSYGLNIGISSWLWILFAVKMHHKNHNIRIHAQIACMNILGRHQVYVVEKRPRKMW